MNEESIFPESNRYKKIVNQDMASKTFTVDGVFKTRERKQPGDHSFSGIMFDIEAQGNLPIDYVEIHSFFVRGQLGPVAVYRCISGSYESNQIFEHQWRCCFKRRHVQGHIQKLVEILLDEPIRIYPGQKVGVYIHSSLPGDEGIVYDDQKGRNSHYTDNFIKIYPGFGHTSRIEFSPITEWATFAWRREREFVGDIRYGVASKQWKTRYHSQFPIEFQKSVLQLLCCQKYSRSNNVDKVTFGALPKDIIFKIVDFLPLHWFLKFEENNDENKIKLEQKKNFNAKVFLTPKFLAKMLKRKKFLAPLLMAICVIIVSLLFKKINMFAFSDG